MTTEDQLDDIRLEDIRDSLETLIGMFRDTPSQARNAVRALEDIHDLLDERLPSIPGGRPADLSASEAEPAPEGGGDPGAMRDSDLNAIRDRVDRNSFPQGDRARLLAEVERLREGITSALSTSRDMQSDVRSSVTLAFLQDALCDLLDPTEGMEAE